MIANDYYMLNAAVLELGDDPYLTPEVGERWGGSQRERWTAELTSNRPSGLSGYIVCRWLE
jgi:hypothetical protein